MSNVFKDVEYEVDKLSLEDSLDKLTETLNKIHKEEIEYLKHSLAHAKLMNEHGWDYRHLRC